MVLVEIEHDPEIMHLLQAGQWNCPDGKRRNESDATAHGSMELWLGPWEYNSHLFTQCCIGDC